MATFSQSYVFASSLLVPYQDLKDWADRNDDGGGLVYGFAVAFNDTLETMTLTKSGTRSTDWSL